MATEGVLIDISGYCMARDSHDKEYVVFAIAICLGPYAWTVYRRNSEFRALYDMLRAQIADTPPCPPKRAGEGSMTPALLERRRLDLLDWIRNLARNERVCCSPIFHNFLRQNANKPPPGITTVAQVATPPVAVSSPAPAGPGAASAAGLPSATPQRAGAAAATVSSPSPSSTSNIPAARGDARRGRVSIDDFVLLKVVGKGSFGKVMQVRKKDTGKVYAMKVLSKSQVVKKNQVEHTRTERAVLSRIDHPFIVGLKFAFQTHDKLYLVLDYCAGGELFFHLGREGRFAEGRAKYYTAQITLALEYLHAHGIVYRDLKPENVLLDQYGNVKLTDFGLSKEGVTSTDSGAHSFCGTPEYLAPEILDRKGHGRAVDWWSLGTLLYEMLTGWPPFYSRERATLFEKIRTGHVDFRMLDHCSAEAKDILSKLLRRNPRERLGCGIDDGREVRSHSFFAGVDWDALLSRSIPPPWRPAVSGATDTSMFDTEFTSLPVQSPASAADGGHLAAAAAIAAAAGAAGVRAGDWSGVSGASQGTVAPMVEEVDWAGFSFDATGTPSTTTAPPSSATAAAVAAAAVAAVNAAAAAAATATATHGPMVPTAVYALPQPQMPHLQRDSLSDDAPMRSASMASDAATMSLMSGPASTLGGSLSFADVVSGRASVAHSAVTSSSSALGSATTGGVMGVAAPLGTVGYGDAWSRPGPVGKAVGSTYGRPGAGVGPSASTHGFAAGSTGLTAAGAVATAHMVTDEDGDTGM